MNAILYFDVEVEQDSNESMTSTKNVEVFLFQLTIMKEYDIIAFVNKRTS